MRTTIQGLGWFVRRTADPTRLAAFYRDVFGLPVLRSSPTATVFWGGETSVFEVTTGGAPQPEYTDREQAPCVPIFRAHGIDGTIARLQAAGVRFINDIHREHNHLAYFVDPDGHVTGLQERYRSSPRDVDAESWRRWDAGEITIPGADPMPPDIQHIGWVVIRGRNMAQAQAFYREVVGLDAFSGAMLTLRDTVLLEVNQGCPPEPVPNDRTEVPNAFVLRVHDVDGITSDLKRQGVHFVNEPFDTPGGRLAYFVDLEGHLVGLQQRSPASDRIEDLEAHRRWQAWQAHPPVPQ